MVQTYRDPTFDEVAHREAVAQRDAARLAEQAERDSAWKNSPEYRRMRRSKIKRLTAKALSGAFRR
nr:hypothetical protein [uncultured Pseudogulbenkiania sp.]